MGTFGRLSEVVVDIVVILEPLVVYVIAARETPICGSDRICNGTFLGHDVISWVADTNPNTGSLRRSCQSQGALIAIHHVR